MQQYLACPRCGALHYLDGIQHREIQCVDCGRAFDSHRL